MSFVRIDPNTDSNTAADWTTSPDTGASGDAVLARRHPRAGRPFALGGGGGGGGLAGRGPAAQGGAVSCFTVDF